MPEPTSAEPASDWYADVRAFHEKFACHIGQRPQFPHESVQALRLRLIEEEFSELREAHDRNDLCGVADAMADLVYVVLGTAVSYGIDLRPVWNEVQRANMAKTGGATRADGKILKPPGWQPPDIDGILKRQAQGPA